MTIKSRLLAIAVLCISGSPAFAQATPPFSLVNPELAKANITSGQNLRAVYLATNPAQTMRQVETGRRIGVVVDLVQELGKRIGKAWELHAVETPPLVIDAVRSGKADIGFVAYEATRLGTVEFSQTYMLVQQSFLVAGNSPIRTVADIDKKGQKIGGTRNDSITLCLKRALKQATPVELDNNVDVVTRAVGMREVDAFGANRQRLTTLMRSLPGSRLLPDNFFNVPQNIVVPMGKPEVLAAVDKFIDEVRESGLLRKSIAEGGAIGVEPAPKSAGSQHGCPG